MSGKRKILKYLNPVNFFVRLVNYDLVEHRLNKLRIEKCYEQVSYENGVKFYEEARVINPQNDKNKITIGANTHIRGELFIFAHGGKIQIGDHCYIGEGSRIWSAHSIVLGNRVLVSHGVNIHDNNSHPNSSKERHDQFVKIINTGHPFGDINIDAKPIVIEDDAWIGFNATLLKGITIGRGAIVGACSVVTKDVEPYSVVIGNPGKVVKILPEELR